MVAIRFPPGNKVTMELTPNDLLRARIVSGRSDFEGVTS